MQRKCNTNRLLVFVKTVSKTKFFQESTPSLLADFSNLFNINTYLNYSLHINEMSTLEHFTLCITLRVLSPSLNLRKLFALSELFGLDLCPSCRCCFLVAVVVAVDGAGAHHPGPDPLRQGSPPRRLRHQIPLKQEHFQGTALSRAQ
jgi:hypothetical protein